MSKTKASARGIGLLLPAALLAWCLTGSEADPPSAPVALHAEQGSQRAPAPKGEPAVPGLRETARAGDREVAAPAAASPGIAAQPLAPPTPPAPGTATPIRVRVVVRLDADAPDCGLPVPELLRLGPRGETSPVVEPAAAPRRHPALELAARTARGEPARTASETSRTFEVRGPGLYAAAWRLWLQVPGTRTWRVRRGRGPELLLPSTGGTREIVVHVGADDLRLDPSLDARAPNAQYTVTAKDG